MFQTQIQLISAATATEVLQSLGFEIAIFAITVALATALRRTRFAKGNSSCAISLDASTPQATVTASKQGHSPGHGRSGSPGSSKPKRQVVTQKPIDPLAQKVTSMIEFASRRQASDAIAMYEEIKANRHNVFSDGSLARGKHQAADVFNQLVHGAGRVGRPDLVEQLLDDMVHAGIERTQEMYEGTMKMLASKKYYKEAMSVCSRLEADGHQPSCVTLSCLINFAVELGELDRAVYFFNRLAATGTPSIRAYMMILRVHSKRQDWTKSLALVHDMQRREAPVDNLVLNVVLATGVAAGQLDAAKALLEDFANISDVVSYNTVMKGFAQQRESNKAMKLLDEMRQVAVRPNAITFNTAMDAAIRSSHVADAWTVLARMRDAGVAPDKFTCTTLMKSLHGGATSEQLTMILDLLRNTIAGCDSTLCSALFRNVIEAAAKLDDPTLTAKVIDQIREQRFTLRPQEQHRLFQLLARDGSAPGCAAACQRTTVEIMRPMSVY